MVQVDHALQLSAQDVQLDAQSLRTFLKRTVQELTGAWPADTLSFSELGLDSLAMSSFVGRVRDRMMLTVKDLDETALFDGTYSTIDGLVQYCMQIGQEQVVAPPVAPFQPQQSSSCYVQAMALEYPQGVSDMNALFSFLTSSRDAVTEVPRARWDVDAYYAEDIRPGFMYTRHGSFICRDPYSFWLVVWNMTFIFP